MGGQGTFMLFYEYNDGFVEVLQDVSDDEVEERSNPEVKENDSEEESKETQESDIEEESKEASATETTEDLATSTTSLSDVSMKEESKEEFNVAEAQVHL